MTRMVSGTHAITSRALQALGMQRAYCETRYNEDNRSIEFRVATACKKHGAVAIFQDDYLACSTGDELEDMYYEAVMQMEFSDDVPENIPKYNSPKAAGSRGGTADPGDPAVSQYPGRLEPCEGSPGSEEAPHDGEQCGQPDSEQSESTGSGSGADTEPSQQSGD